jgi:putative transposase
MGERGDFSDSMPKKLKRYYGKGDLHFITFSCYRRFALLGSVRARNVLIRALREVRLRYRFALVGYVVMPEHVHLLITEPGRAKLAVALQMLKQNVARKVREPEGGSFWQARYYDFNVWSEAKRIEKLRYIHRNPVRRGLVTSPEQWPWSSFRHYLSGADGIVEIESQWAARKREQLAVAQPLVPQSQPPRPVSAKNAETRTGHPRVG